MNTMETHLIETLQALLEQETKFYPPIQPYMGANAIVVSSTETDASTQRSPPWRLNVKYRETMAKWAYEVTDHFGFSRSIVAIAMNYFDRFLAHQPDWIYRHENVRVLTITTLYLAIKLFAEFSLAPDCLAELSCGSMTSHDIEAMERQILVTLDWYVHPPPPEDFLRVYLKTSVVPREVVDRALFILDHVVLDYYFIRQKPSVIAMAALLQALGNDSEKKMPVLTELCDSIDPVALMECRHRIHNIMAFMMEPLRIMSPTSVIVSKESYKNKTVEK